MSNKSSGEGRQSKTQKKVYRDTNLQIIFGVTLMAVMGVASLSPAFPKMVQELSISSQDIGLLITIFTLPGILLTFVLGVLADQFGRKKILVPSLMLFGIAGGACSLVRDFNLLLLLRFFQGMGAASLGSLNVTIIGDLYSGKERTTAMGFNASVLSVGTASYPAIGGVLAMVGWYYPFILPFIAIPIGLLVLFSLKNPEPKKGQHFKEYFSNVWKSIKNRHVVGLFSASVITFIILYGAYLTYFPLLIGLSFEAPPLIIGLIMSSMSLITALTSSQLGRLVKISSERSLIKAAFILYALALAIIPSVSDLWLFLIPITIFGIAHGINIPSIQTLLAGLAPIEYRAAFMSINGMVLRLGQTLGPFLMGMVFVIEGMGGVFYAGVGFSIFSFILMVIMMK
ncbi:MAG: MFS transporter [Candidatus Methylarchaceae archaeon HK01M]|nr:MFS transporter [Candidatus Methylarchaceae archaeon HK01M]